MSAAGADRSGSDVAQVPGTDQIMTAKPEGACGGGAALVALESPQGAVAKPVKKKGKETLREDWEFDPKFAVDLVFGKRKETFPHQLSVYSYLLLVWMIWPNSPAVLRGAARSAALR